MKNIAAVLGIDLEDPKEQAYLAMQRERHDLVQDLVRIREDRGLTQEDVANQLGISRVAVSRFEREDRDVKISTLIRYAEAVEAVISLRADKVEHSATYVSASSGGAGTTVSRRLPGWKESTSFGGSVRHAATEEGAPIEIPRLNQEPRTGTLPARWYLALAARHVDKWGADAQIEWSGE